MTADAPVLTAGFWRTRRSAAIAGIVFAVLLLAAMTMARIALAESSFQTLAIAEAVIQWLGRILSARTT